MSTQTANTKTETSTSTGNPFAAFSGSYKLAHAFVEAFAAHEAELVGRTQDAMKAFVQLASDSMAYAIQLSTDARKLGFEAVRKFTG